MTSQKDKIQSLITEIESVLNRASPRLSWVLAGEATRQRDLLQKTRDYLHSLKQVLDAPGGWGPLDPTTGQLAPGPSMSLSTEPESSAAQVLQALLMEMRYLKENSLQPMRLELEDLTRQRELLRAEIDALESQRLAAANQPDQLQINAFLETLIERLQSHLSNQVASAIARLETGRVNEGLLQLEVIESESPNRPRLHPSERLDQLRLLQSQSDQLLLKLDATLETVFESLQKSVESYKASLAEGLEHMHGLGRQGEVIFHSLVNQLAQQLGQDASLYLNSDLNANVPRQLDAAVEPIESAASLEDARSASASAQDELDLALDSLDLDLDIALDEQDLTVIQLDEPLVDETVDLSGLDNEIQLEEDITVIQTEADFSGMIVADANLSHAEAVTLADLAAGDPEESLQDDLNADDLDLLSQTDFQPITETPVETAAEGTLETFYESMFGAEAVTPAPLPTAAVDATILDQTVIPETVDGIMSGLPFEGVTLPEWSEDVPEITSDLPEHTHEWDGPQIDAEGSEAEGIDTSENFFFDAAGLADIDLTEGNEDEPIILEHLLEDDGERSTLNSENPLDDLFGDGLADVPELADVAEPSVDTIESLAELLPEIIEGDAAVASGLDRFDPLDEIVDGDTAQDTYISAPVGENLLSPEVPADEQRFALELGDDLIHQLDSDLQNLGQIQGSDATDGLIDLNFDETGLMDQLDQREVDFTLDQATLENLVADLDLSEETELDLEPDVSPEDDLNALASALLASDDIDDPLELSPETLAETSETVSFSLDALPDDLSLDDFMPDSSELPALESEESALMAEEIMPLAADAASSPVDLDLDESWEDLGLEGLAASLGDIGTPLTVDLAGDDDQAEVAGFSDDLTEVESASQEPSNELMADELAFIDLTGNELREDERVPIDRTGNEQIQVELAQDDLSSDLLTGSDLSRDLLESLTLADLLPETALDPTEDFATAELPLGEGLDPQPFSTGAEVLPDIGMDDLANDLEMDVDDFEIGSMPEGLAEELADLSQQADQQEPLAILGDGLLSDFEEPILFDGPMPTIPSIPETEPKLDSALIPDLPGDDLEAMMGIAPGNFDGDYPSQADRDAVPLASLATVDLVSPVVLPDATETDADDEALNLLSEFESPELISSADGGTTAVATEPDAVQPLWYLGLDLGTTGISAVLLDHAAGQVYPLYWLSSGVSEPEKHFRLPVGAWLAADEIAAVGYAAWQRSHQTYQRIVPPESSGILLKQLKPLLKIAVPHGVQAGQYEPILQWSDVDTFPLQWVQTALEEMLKQIVPGAPTTSASAGFGTIGLDQPALEQALLQLQGVVIGYPTNWPDTYSFNVREAVLASGLIVQANQIFFIEDAIATILSGLPDPNAEVTDQTTALSRQPSLYNCDWEGGTVVISAGASLTELAVVNLPTTLSDLTYGDFALRSFPYAGDSLDQDIICQLLYPSDSRQILSEPAVPVATQDWHWQAELPTWAAADWASLELDSLTLPQPGEPDLKLRHQLQQRLERSPLGQSVVEAARHLKLILQHQSQFQLDLGLQRWMIKRRDLESRIFLPYIQRINRHLNVLLSQKGFSTQTVKQVICTGGSASLPAIARWLRQKFPNATIIQDTYAGDRPNSCSRVAYGLVNLVRYPQVLDITRQQYSDYFLLMELLRVFPQQPLPVSGIMHLLEQRGINTQACQLHILALLEGHLPPGLVPTESDRPFISNRSTDIVTYQALTEAPLFTKQSGQIYVPNEEQCRRLRAYLEQLMAQKAQNLDEPMIAQLAIEALAEG